MSGAKAGKRGKLYAYPKARGSVRGKVREGKGEPRWLSRVALEAFHDAQIIEHGGSPGVRDEGLLESAMARPRNKWANGEANISVLAAAYAFGLAKNQAFTDGNKRSAFQAAYALLGLNGYDLDAAEPEVVDVMNRVASSGMTEAALAKWIGEHMVGERTR